MSYLRDYHSNDSSPYSTLFNSQAQNMNDLPGSTFQTLLFDHSTPSSTTSSLTTPQSSTFPLDQLELPHSYPIIPSTHLPSYYPDSRDRLPLLPSQRLTEQVRTASHGAADVDRISASGPSSRHLLDGVALTSSPPRPSRPTIATPTYDLSPTVYMNDLHPSVIPWVPKRRREWDDSPFNEIEQGSSTNHFGTMESSGFPGQVSMSAISTQNPTSSAGYNGDSVQESRTQPSSFPGGFSLPPSRSYSAASNTSQQGLTGMSYPDLLYGGMQIPDGSASVGTDQSKVTGDDYAKALKMYQQLHAAIPHIRPLSQPSPDPPGVDYQTLLRLAQEGIAIVTGQQIPNPVAKPPAPPTSRPTPSSAPSKRAQHGKEKASTKCLGCGATETPEWRRGPMGPRTLCNACGLVHMKLQRKKRKLEEKAAAAAASSSKKS